jgi:hypothetical protein
MQEVMKALGLDQLGLENDLDLDQVLKLTEVVTDYLAAGEDKNEGLKKIKRKQFKEMYIKMFTDSDNKYLK